ncbi:hypothetical protein M422DRAFT_28685 [Sphaerobolus stellatus SS14]|uniref:Uncharacterized protein n=1 Tax=Sphaerobolus stellatus (strain SS14) TaxID=990650 RepID=A0A0C9W4P1_SPHS4|nr:hypothetical protein M422DRAFT_28685 [Sphaerobolus stellatus SS14]
MSTSTQNPWKQKDASSSNLASDTRSKSPSISVVPPAPKTALFPEAETTVTSEQHEANPQEADTAVTSEQLEAAPSEDDTSNGTSVSSDSEFSLEDVTDVIREPSDDEYDYEASAPVGMPVKFRRRRGVGRPKGVCKADQRIRY